MMLYMRSILADIFDIFNTLNSKLIRMAKWKITNMQINCAVFQSLQRRCFSCFAKKQNTFMLFHPIHQSSTKVSSMKTNNTSAAIYSQERNGGNKQPKFISCMNTSPLFCVKRQHASTSSQFSSSQQILTEKRQMYCTSNQHYNEQQDSCESILRQDCKKILALTSVQQQFTKQSSKPICMCHRAESLNPQQSYKQDFSVFYQHQQNMFNMVFHQNKSISQTVSSLLSKHYGFHTSTELKKNMIRSVTKFSSIRNFSPTYSQYRLYRGRLRRDSPLEDDQLVLRRAETQAIDSDKAVERLGMDLQKFEKEFEETLPSVSVNEMTLPELSRHACNLVPYVCRSETLQNLVKLGVNLDVVQKVEGVAELLLKSKFERDIAPLLHLFHLMGVPGDAMGSMLTRNPLLFTQSVEELSARFGFFLHGGFSQREAASIVIRAPVTLLLHPAKLKSKLTFLEDTFGLSGHELKQVVLKYPKIIPWRRDMIANVRFHLKDFLSFCDKDLKTLLIKEPKIYMTSARRLTESFEYLFNTMGIPRQLILQWPGILQTRPHIVMGRHLFLESRGQAQYDPRLENYVSLKVLGSGPDADFCKHVAKCEEKEFFDFLKTL